MPLKVDVFEFHTPKSQIGISFGARESFVRVYIIGCSFKLLEVENGIKKRWEECCNIYGSLTLWLRVLPCLGDRCSMSCDEGALCISDYLIFSYDLLEYKMDGVNTTCPVDCMSKVDLLLRQDVHVSAASYQISSSFPHGRDLANRLSSHIHCLAQCYDM